MRIAFVGKGGSGKTTLASLFARYHSPRIKTFLFDADINQHLPHVLGIPKNNIKKIISLSQKEKDIKKFIQGKNSRIKKHADIIKTTPPGKGSGIIYPSEKDNLLSQLSYPHESLHLLCAGEPTPEDTGIRCYHAKTGLVELLLNHTHDTKDELITADMTAGADAFSSGLFTRFDLTCIVVEPTHQSLRVYEQYFTESQKHDVALAVIGNKIHDETDKLFLQKNIRQEHLLAFFPFSSFVRSIEKGAPQKITTLTHKEKDVLEKIFKRLALQKRNWSDYLKKAHYFHIKNAQSWANETKGMTLEHQIDPDFSFLS